MNRLTSSLLLPLCLGVTLQAQRASAEFVVPRVPAAPKAAETQQPPSSSFTVWTVTTLADSGAGSLRQAVSNAVAGDQVVFNVPAHSQIVLQSTIVINKDLTITGPGPLKLAVARDSGTNTPNFRIFTVDSGVVSISGLLLRNGRATSTSGFEDNLGGAILNWGSLTVSNCVLAGNAATTVGTSYGFGGAIFALGPLTLLDSTLRENSASFAGGGLCTFHSPNVVVKGSTIAGNFAGLQSAGVNFQGITGLIENSTISGNAMPPDGVASALLNICFENEGSHLTLTADTIVDNIGSTNGAVIFAAFPDNLGQTNLMLSTLVARNQGANFAFFSSEVQSLGHNLDSDGTSGLVNGANGDIVGTAGSPIDPKLKSLQNNGGPTLTHGLLPGSPALNAAACVDAHGASLPIDQRGQPRPSGPACDIGSFENQRPSVVCPAAATNVVNTPQGASVTLTATVDDPDGDALVAVWTVDGTTVQTNEVSETHPPASSALLANLVLSVGAHTVSVTVTDGKAAPATCSTVITVVDTRPPTIISIVASPSILWPPSHRLVPVRIYVTATDPSGPVTSRIISVTSNEPTNGQVDWIITGDLTLLLRAERSGHGTGRIYTITVEVTNASGAKSTGTVTVTVPKSQGNAGILPIGEISASSTPIMAE